MINFKYARKHMVEEQIKDRGVRNPAVLEAFIKVERHKFIPTEYVNHAYDDYPLPIGYDQTISQPFMTALMTELLDPSKDEVVLEIGTGSGFQTAILSKLAKFVISIERVAPLARRAKETLKKLGYNNASVMIGDGSLGWKDNAPYDGIMVTAGAPVMPKALISQLKPGGRMVIPIGEGYQKLQLILKEEEGYTVKEVIDCTFVPLIMKGINDE